MKKTNIIFALVALALCGRASEPLQWGVMKPAADALTAQVAGQWSQILNDSRVSPPKGTSVFVTTRINAKGEVEVLSVEDSGAGKQGVFSAENAITYPQPFTAFASALKQNHFECAKIYFIFRYSGNKSAVKTSPLELEAAAPEPAMTVVEESNAARTEYLRTHPNIDEKIAKAIQDGKLLTGMDWKQAEATLGHLGFDARSEGEGATVESWNGRDKLYRYTLYFVEGRLTRWTTFSLY